MSTGLLERTDEETTTDSGDSNQERRCHYWNKGDLERVWLEGATITALCGYKARPTITGDNLPMCQKCKQTWEALRAR